ncbi:hypothetical protein TNCV_1063491 [Trichonephila clavipes]|nr:hypothetical protein TNCV_1063491 [Trichonephila clavipes]
MLPLLPDYSSARYFTCSISQSGIPDPELIGAGRFSLILVANSFARARLVLQSFETSHSVCVRFIRSGKSRCRTFRIVHLQLESD